MKADRNYALRSIQRIIKQNKETKFLNIIKEINKSEDDSRRMQLAIK